MVFKIEEMTFTDDEARFKLTDPKETVNAIWKPITPNLIEEAKIKWKTLDGCTSVDYLMFYAWMSEYGKVYFAEDFKGGCPKDDRKP